MILIIEIVTRNVSSLLPFARTILHDALFWYETLVKPIKSGLIPVIDFSFPNEPLGFVLFIFLISMIINSQHQFLYAFGLIQIVFDLGIVWYLMKIAETLKIRLIKRISLIYCFSPTIVILGYARFDLMPAFFIIGSIYYYLIRKDFISSLLISFGVFIKLFPIALLISIATTEYNERVRVLKFIGMSFLLTFLFYVPFFVINIDLLSFWGFYTATSLVRPDSVIGVIGLWTQNSYNNLLRTVFLAVLVIFTLLTLVKGPKNFIRRTTAFISVFLAFIGYIYSPQWNIWLIPLLILDDKINWKVIYLFELSNVIIFPILYTMVEIAGGFTYFSFLNLWHILFAFFIGLRTLTLIFILYRFIFFNKSHQF